MSINETYEPVASRLRASVEEINGYLKEAGETSLLSMEENPIHDRNHILRGYQIKIADRSGRIRLSCVLEDVGYPQWYGLSILSGFVDGYLCALSK